MSNLRKNLAKKIKALRGKSTQRDFADKIGISHATVNRMEQETENITIDTIQTICKKLKCKAGDLLDD